MKLSRGSELLYHKDNSRYTVLEYTGAYNVGFVLSYLDHLLIVVCSAGHTQGKSATLSCPGPRWLRMVFPALK